MTLSPGHTDQPCKCATASAEALRRWPAELAVPAVAFIVCRLLLTDIPDADSDPTAQDALADTVQLTAAAAAVPSRRGGAPRTGRPVAPRLIHRRVPGG